MPIDFLSGCDNCYIITDGSEIKLSNSTDIGNTSIIYNVTSFEVLQDSWNMYRLPFMEYSSGQLPTTDPKAGTEPIKLHPGFIQFGPYFSLPKDNYLIEIRGNNLQDVNSESIYVYHDAINEGEDFVIQNVSIKEDRISYELLLEKDLSGMELGIQNETNDIITIDKLCIYEDERLPEILSSWW